jgi:hypothetical protein
MNNVKSSNDGRRKSSYSNKTNIFFFIREEINKRLKSKAGESGSKSEEEGEIDDHDDNDSDNTKSTRKSNLFDNDIYAEDDDDDDYRASTNRRKQINASKQKETEHSKSLQLLIEGRKKKQGK